jgi:hypothetical protein
MIIIFLSLFFFCLGEKKNDCILEYKNYEDNSVYLNDQEFSRVTVTSSYQKSCNIDSLQINKLLEVKGSTSKKIGLLLNDVEGIPDSDSLRNRLKQGIPVFAISKLDRKDYVSYFFLVDFSDKSEYYVAKKIYMVNVSGNGVVKSIVCVSDILSTVGENDVTGFTSYSDRFIRYFILKNDEDVRDTHLSTIEKVRIVEFEISVDGLIEILKCN